MSFFSYWGPGKADVWFLPASECKMADSDTDEFSDNELYANLGDQFDITELNEDEARQLVWEVQCLPLLQPIWLLQGLPHPCHLCVTRDRWQQTTTYGLDCTYVHKGTAVSKLFFKVVLVFESYWKRYNCTKQRLISNIQTMFKIDFSSEVLTLLRLFVTRPNGLNTSTTVADFNRKRSVSVWIHFLQPGHALTNQFNLNYACLL